MDNLLSKTIDKYVFHLHAKSVNGEMAGCHGFEEVFSFRVTMINRMYLTGVGPIQRITPSVSLEIERAIEIVRETQQVGFLRLNYHMLLIRQQLPLLLLCTTSSPLFHTVAPSLCSSTVQASHIITDSTQRE